MGLVRDSREISLNIIIEGTSLHNNYFSFGLICLFYNLTFIANLFRLVGIFHIGLTEISS